MVKVANRELAGKTVVASFRVEDQPWIRGGPGLVTVNEDGHVWVEIQNNSPVPRELPRMLAIGEIEECEIVCLMDEQKISSMRVKIADDDKKRRWTTQGQDGPLLRSQEERRGGRPAQSKGIL